MSIFDDELQQLKEKILKMGSMVEEAIREFSPGACGQGQYPCRKCN